MKIVNTFLYCISCIFVKFHISNSDTYLIHVQICVRTHIFLPWFICIIPSPIANYTADSISFHKKIINALSQPFSFSTIVENKFNIYCIIYIFLCPKFIVISSIMYLISYKWKHDSYNKFNASQCNSRIIFHEKLTKQITECIEILEQTKLHMCYLYQ